MSGRSRPGNCRDYVIKDGRFIGRFEEMYKNCADPWDQSSDVPQSAIRQDAIRLMRQYPIRTIVEWGCGLGYYTEQLVEQGFDVQGIDIAPSAIDTARRRRPDLRFAVDDLGQISNYAADAVLFSELTWYVLPQLKLALERMPAKYFVQVLTFYPPGQQQYGRDYFASFDEFVAWCPLRLTASTAVVVENHTKTAAIFER
jgi:SAM-dependent methyltransferase